MFRRVIAGLILGPALLIGSFAWAGYLALQTVFDEDRSATIARELLDNEEVRGQVAENLGVAIERGLPEGVPVSAAQVDAAALAVLEETQVTPRAALDPATRMSPEDRARLFTALHQDYPLIYVTGPVWARSSYLPHRPDPRSCQARSTLSYLRS